MKAVLQSAWLLTVAIGNLIDVIVAAAKFFPEQVSTDSHNFSKYKISKYKFIIQLFLFLYIFQSKEFFLFAGLMFLDMIWFSYMAWRYVPAQLEDPNKKKSIASGTDHSEHENKDS